MPIREATTTKSSPQANAANGGLSGLAGAAAAAAVISNNPEQQALAVFAGGATTGFLSGLGNWARSFGGFSKVLFGWF